MVVSFAGAVVPYPCQVLGHAGGRGVAGVFASVGGDGVGEQGAGSLAVAEGVEDEGGGGVGGEGPVGVGAIGGGEVVGEVPIEVVAALEVSGAAVGGGEQVQGVEATWVGRPVEVDAALMGVGGPGGGVGRVAESQLQFGQQRGGFDVHRVGGRGGGVDAGEAVVQELPGA